MAATESGDSANAARESHAFALTSANRNSELASLAAFGTAMHTLVGGSVDRARMAAQIVQSSSAAIAVLYSGVLALVFSARSNPLPLRGVLTPLFLGLAVVLSSAYIAYLGEIGKPVGSKPGGRGPEPKAFARINDFSAVVTEIVKRRVWCLRASVVALGLGLLFIPAPFLTIGHPAAPSATLPTEPAWPLPPHAAHSRLAAILYQAEVNEVATARSKLISASISTDTFADAVFLAIGAVSGLLVLCLVATYLGPGKEERAKGEVDKA